MYKNIVFDMGNVLINYEPKKYVEEVGLESEIEKKAIFDLVFQGKLYLYYDRGDFTYEEYVKILINEMQQSKYMNNIFKNPKDKKYEEIIKKLLSDWNKSISPVKGMAEFIKLLKTKGYKIYLLSNASYNQHEYWKRIPGNELFDGTLVSCDVKLIKPDYRIYEKLFSTFNIKPEESIFIDDLPINIYGSEEAGMKGIVFHGDVEELKNCFEQLGIL